MFKQKVLETNSINNNLKDLLADFLDENQMKDLSLENSLSKIQNKAFELFKKGMSILLIGQGGVGKSKCIKTMEEYNKMSKYPKNMVLCATTGVAAYNIGGMTINSFMGIGTAERDVQYLIRRVSRRRDVCDRLRMLDILAIDEVSMMSAELFEKINVILQTVRKNKMLFGGVQLILSCDPLQLLPVFNRNQLLRSYESNEPEDTRLIVESDIFKKHFSNKNIIILQENFRQKNDTKWLDTLTRIRKGKQIQDDIELLMNKVKNFEEEYKELKEKNIIPIHIVATNKKAQEINEINLKKLSTKEVRYQTLFQASGSDNEIIDTMKKEFELQFKQRGIFELILKEGARVMLLRNLDVSIGLVNGSMGIIESIKNGIPFVKFDNGTNICINRETFEMDVCGNQVVATQIPLMIAYSLTSHKCQGLTLEYAIMDLNECFTDGQVYTALSRVKTLNGLLLKSFNPKKIKVNNIMKDFCK